jgi:hypothetical protein
MDFGGKDALAAAMAAAQGQIKLADMVYAQTAEKLNAEVKLHQITESQKTQQLLSALVTRYTAEVQAIGDEQALYAVGTAGWQKALNERMAAFQKYAQDRQKIVDQEAEAENKKWNAAADQIASAFNSQLRGLLAGTTSWGQAMKNVAGDVAIKFIGDQVKIELEALASQARIVAGQIASQLGMTSATEAGVAARSAAEASGASTSIILQAGAALKSITTDAAKVFADVFAYFAPTMGPFAAAPAAAASAVVLATAGTIPHAATGGLVLSDGLIFAHANETVVPAAMSQPFQGGQGGGSPNINLTYNATGMLSYAEIQRNANVIANAVAQQFARNPSMMGG